MEEKAAQTLVLLQKVWSLLLIAVYVTGFMDAYLFPGSGPEPQESQAFLWNLQRLFFFGLMFAGFLIDVVRMREDRNKAFLFLFLSLLLGGFSGGIGALQYRAIAFFFGRTAGLGSLPEGGLAEGFLTGVMGIFEAG